MEHTKTPWKDNSFRQDNIDHPAQAVWTADGESFICSTRAPHDKFTGAPSTRQAHINARHIVRCVNSHDALVAALEKSVQRIGQLCATTNTLSNKLGLGDKVRAADFTDCARAALALAKGE